MGKIKSAKRNCISFMYFLVSIFLSKDNQKIVFINGFLLLNGIEHCGLHKHLKLDIMSMIRYYTDLDRR